MASRCAVLASLSLVVGCAASELEPRTTGYVRTEMHEPAPVVNEIEAPAGPARFWRTPAAFYRPPPPRRSFSLGFIGDEPLGRFDAPAPPRECPPQRPWSAGGSCRCAYSFGVRDSR